MANQWFETVAIAQQRAKKRLPASSYGAIVAGAEAGAARQGEREADREERCRQERGGRGVVAVHGAASHRGDGVEYYPKWGY